MTIQQQRLFMIFIFIFKRRYLKNTPPSSLNTHSISSTNLDIKRKEKKIWAIDFFLFAFEINNLSWSSGNQNNAETVYRSVFRFTPPTRGGIRFLPQMKVCFKLNTLKERLLNTAQSKSFLFSIFSFVIDVTVVEI